MILDEPTSALGERDAGYLFSVVREFGGKGNGGSICVSPAARGFRTVRYGDRASRWHERYAQREDVRVVGNFAERRDSWT